MKKLNTDKAIIVLAAALCLAPCIRAQEQILTTEFARLPDGRGQLAVTNNSETITVMAYVIIHQSLLPGRDRPIANGGDFKDVLFHSEQHNNFQDAIEPLETRRFRFGTKGSEIQNQIELKAAVFSDGTTWGDREWVQRILKSRRYFYDDLGLAIEKIKAALDAGSPVEPLRQEFDQLHNSVHPGPNFEHYEEARAAGNVFGTVAVHLSQIPTSAQDQKQSLALLLPMLMTWQGRIAGAKPSILAASK